MSGIHPELLPEHWLRENGFDPFEIWGANPRSRSARRAAGLYQQTEEGQALLRKIREAEDRESKQVADLRVWADRLGVSAPTDDEIRSACSEAGTSAGIREAFAALEDAIVASASEQKAPVIPGRRWLPVVSTDRVTIQGAVGRWDGVDVVWERDDAEWAAHERREAERAEQSRRGDVTDRATWTGAGYSKVD